MCPHWAGPLTRSPSFCPQSLIPPAHHCGPCCSPHPTDSRHREVRRRPQVTQLACLQQSQAANPVQAQGLWGRACLPVDGSLPASLRIHRTQSSMGENLPRVESGRKWEAGGWLFWKSDMKNHETSYLSRFAPICPPKQGCPSPR